MNFTNSPYGRMMKEVPHYEKSAPQKVPEGAPCVWVIIGRVSPVIPAIKSTSKNRADMLTFDPE